MLPPPLSPPRPSILNNPVHYNKTTELGDEAQVHMVRAMTSNTNNAAPAPAPAPATTATPATTPAFPGMGLGMGMGAGAGAGAAANPFAALFGGMPPMGAPQQQLEGQQSGQQPAFQAGANPLLGGFGGMGGMGGMGGFPQPSPQQMQAMQQQMMQVRVWVVCMCGWWKGKGRSTQFSSCANPPHTTRKHDTEPRHDAADDGEPHDAGHAQQPGHDARHPDEQPADAGAARGEPAPEPRAERPAGPLFLGWLGGGGREIGVVIVIGLNRWMRMHISQS